MPAPLSMIEELPPMKSSAEDLIIIFDRECEKWTGFLFVIFNLMVVGVAVMFGKMIFIPAYFAFLDVFDFSASFATESFGFLGIIFISLLVLWRNLDRILRSVLAFTYMYQAATFAVVYEISFQALVGHIFLKYPAICRSAWKFKRR